MIGPSSGTSEGMPNREANESPGTRAKRKVFEELDIDNLCDDSCQVGKKRYHLTELSSANDINGDSSSLLSSQKSGSSSIAYLQNAGFSPMSSEEFSSSSGSMARLEVLVVDGNWDESSMSGNLASLTNLHHHSNAMNSSVLSEIQSLDNYGTIGMPNYWDSTASVNTAAAAAAAAAAVAVAANVNGINNSPEVFVPQNIQSPAEDQENGNLSWLLDFKLDSLIEAPEEKCPLFGSRDNRNGNAMTTTTMTTTATTTTTATNIGSNRFTGNRMSAGSSSSSASISSYMQEMRKPYSHGGSLISSGAGAGAGAGAGLGHLKNDANPSPSNGYNPLVQEPRNLGNTGRYGGPKKPPFTYTELIEHALQERGELTVSAIYQWISEHFPYYKSNDDRWKNSVRHNLSINPHFRKGSKAPHGAGHLWAIANRGEARPRQTVPTVVSGLPRQLAAKSGQENGFRKSVNNSRSQLINQVVTMEEIAAATASIQQPDDNNEIINSVTLEHCAEQILSGIKREVEVQYLVPMVIPNNGEHNSGQHNQQNCQSEQHCHVKETDFLNPVSKEVVAEECGLIGEGYLVTDLNPTTLGLNMVESETISPENLFGEELSFQFYELTSPSQLQSA